MDAGSEKCFKYYAALLKNEGATSRNLTEVDNGVGTTHPNHLLWMCEFCLTNDMPVDKYSRWLGFIQGCLISKGWTTVEIERNRTRPWFIEGE